MAPAVGVDGWRSGQRDHPQRALGDLQSQAEATGRVWAHATAAPTPAGR